MGVSKEMRTRARVACYVNGLWSNNLKDGLRRCQLLDGTTSHQRTEIRGILKDGMACRIPGAIIVPEALVVDL